MSVLDGAIIALYFLLVVVVGLLFAKRAGRSLEDFFVAGRKVPWWLAGAGMIATTFAADTPLVVCGLVATYGVAGNWLWWCMVMSGIFTVFVTARLWHRAHVLSDVEIVELRYGGAPARALRVFRALYLALPVNLIILGWVHLAMVKVLRITLGIDAFWAMVACFLVTVAYAAAGGLWAALVTDAVQLVIMMVAIIVLAVFAVDKVGGTEAMIAGAAKHFGSVDAAISVIPPVDSPWLPPLALGVFFFVQWWAAWYPGAEPGGGGYVAQRIFSTRSENDGVLATLFFNVGHYALRPWPWIVVGLCSVTLYPGGVTLDGKPDVEASYAQAIVDLLPSGWRGLMLAGFAAAYMSTVSTHLNWGASYLVNDIYKRFLRPNADNRQLVRASRLATAGIFVLSVLVTLGLDTIAGAWKLLMAIGAGSGAVLILRFLWWRVSAISEIAAMTASLASSLLFSRLLTDENPAIKDAKVMLATVVSSTVVWLVATFSTRPESDDVLRAFVERVRPFGPGWRAVYARLGLAQPPVSWTRMGVGFCGGVVLVYASIFAIGKLTLGFVGEGLAFSAVALTAFALVAWVLRRTQQEHAASGSAPSALSSRSAPPA